MKHFVSIIFGLFLFLISVNYGLASGFNLKSIGSVNVSGLGGGHWWYTTENPLLSGDALPTVAVDVSIDGVTETAPISSDGSWQYQPKTLGGGDHQMILTSGGSTIKFILTIGADKVDWGAVEKGGGEALPATGNTELTWLLIATGLAGIGLGGKIVLNAAKK